MEVTDWNGRAVVLTGLELSSMPSQKRIAIKEGYVHPFPDNKVRNQLRTLAIYLYNHQKMIPIYQANVTNGKNTLVYFVCALFEPNSSASPSKHERPRLRNSVPLPLEYWDRLYYVISAEIRKIYSDLQQRFGNDFGNGNVILHHAGHNGASGADEQPFSAVRMAEMLEDMFETLTDHRLVAALDKAVRLRNAKAKMGGADNLEAAADKAKIIENADALADVNGMTPERIIDMVWAKEAAEARRTSGRSIEEQTLLAACRAEVLETGIAGRRSNEQATAVAFCKCDDKCRCRSHCDNTADQCSCAYMRNQVTDLVNGQEELHDSIHDTFDSPGVTLPNNVLGAVTNEAAQMQIGALASPDPWIVRACYATSEAADKLDKDILAMRRARSNTNNSDLAYVPPPRTPSRSHKDAYPLGFYGDSSGQRYPPFRPNVQDVPPPVYGASCYSSQVPTRKPVPPPIAPPPVTPSDSGISQSCDGVQTPGSSPLDHVFPQTGQVAYPAIPTSQSQGLFTQSFPVADSGNPRDADTDTTVSAADYTYLAEETHNSIRPFSEDPTMLGAANTHPRPHLFTAATAAADTQGGPLTRATLFASATSPDGLHALKLRNVKLDLTKPQPPLPEPDFIAPRPAQKQRYVSAGGNAKLAERQEIDGPAFMHTHSGADMNKDELYQKLHDPDFIRYNFGDAAVKMSVSMERSSQESDRSKRISGQESKRGSADYLIKHDKRERTQSGGSTGSARFGKLKRVFSRKNSDDD